MAEDTRDIVITVKLSRKTYYLFKTFCRANRIPVYQGVEEALQAVMQWTGVPVEPEVTDQLVSSRALKGDE